MNIYAMHVNNIGTILLSDNTYIYQQTNNIDVRQHLILNYVEKEAVKILFFC